MGKRKIISSDCNTAPPALRRSPRLLQKSARTALADLTENSTKCKKTVVKPSSKVSLSVKSNGQDIFRKESQVEERELRLATELPESYVAGSSLVNLIFKVTDSFGSMDTNIHHDEKSGSFHTMRIESDASIIENGNIYAFIHGSCKVPSLSLPQNEGVVNFKVFHSQFPKLHVDMKVQITSASTNERDEIGCSTPHSRTTHSGMGSNQNQWLTPTSKLGLEQTPTFGVAPIKDSSSSHSSQIGLINTFKEELKETLKYWKAKHEKAMEELSLLQASLQALGSPYPEYLSNKESIMKMIEEKHPNTAASVFCSIYRKAPPPQYLFLSMKGMFGVVALLGSVASTSLSRVLSEYLGKQKMLALVCSSQFGQKKAEYLRFQSEAARLNRSISDGFLVICLDETRPWMNGHIENDPQRRLDMENPYLPNGDPMPGFLGYAVNLIDLSLEALNLQTNSGQGLRETLFYGVFGQLQVYDTEEHLEAALPYLNNEDAVSVDGAIFKEKRFIYTRCSEPEIHFPITVPEEQEKGIIKMVEARENKRKAEEMIVEGKSFLEKFEKRLKKATEKYQQFSGDVTDY